ncbi:hypothetical protein BD626DRAFT_505870, partial [Schizophyllum amplum]
MRCWIFAALLRPSYTCTTGVRQALEGRGLTQRVTSLRNTSPLLVVAVVPRPETISASAAVDRMVVHRSAPKTTQRRPTRGVVLGTRREKLFSVPHVSEYSPGHCI